MNVQIPAYSVSVRPVPLPWWPTRGAKCSSHARSARQRWWPHLSWFLCIPLASSLTCWYCYKEHEYYRDISMKEDTMIVICLHREQIRELDLTFLPAKATRWRSRQPSLLTGLTMGWITVHLSRWHWVPCLPHRYVQQEGTGTGWRLGQCFIFIIMIRWWECTKTKNNPSELQLHQANWHQNKGFAWVWVAVISDVQLAKPAGGQRRGVVGIGK